MPNANIIITGNITYSRGKNPFANARIEIWDITQQSNGYGVIASAYSDLEGNFELTIVKPVSPLIGNGAVHIGYKIYKNNILILQEAIGNYTVPITINVDEGAADLVLPDTTDMVGRSFVAVDGKLLDYKGYPVRNAVINISEKSYRHRLLIASCKTDNHGEFRTKVYFKNIDDGRNKSVRCMIVEAVANGQLVAVSGDVFYYFDSRRVSVSLKTENPIGDTEFERIAADIVGIIDPDEIADLVVDDESKENEIRYVAQVLGEPYEKIVAIVTAHRFGKEANFTPKLLYALFKEGGKNTDSILTTTRAEVITAIENAVANGSISNVNMSLNENDYEHPILDFLNQLTEHKVELAKSSVILGENYTLNDVLMAIFDDQDVVDVFLSVHDGRYTDTEIVSIKNVWDVFSDYTIANGGVDLSPLGQAGLKLASITCFQPQTMRYILANIGFDLIHTLASYTLDQWTNLIYTVCTTAPAGLYIPSSIRKDETEVPAVDNAEVITLYALKMMGILQYMYPMSCVNGELGNDDGTLIGDTNIRNNVMTFLSANPIFDLRVRAVHDIGKEQGSDLVIDPSFSEEDIKNIKDALEPFQRLFRVVGGNPKAVCQLIADGVSSARAIVNMPVEYFSAIYDDLFPPQPVITDQTSDQQQQPVPSENPVLTHPAGYLLGIAPGTEIVYKTAKNIAEVTGHGITNAVLGALGSSSQTYVDDTTGEIISHNRSGDFNLHPRVPTIPSGSTYPAIPAVFPGGYLAAAGDNPTLASLFGNLDYCACCDCMSLYSPAAYLSDLLKFVYDSDSSSHNNFNALIKKRADLQNIDLSCNNSDTEMPYIDIVNEILELQVLRGTTAAFPSGGFSNFSFQTTGTAAQIAAYPEHTYKDSSTTPPSYKDYTDVYGAYYNHIYDNSNLAGSLYPSSLPFNLSIEETRTYLQHFGTSRLELMKLFLPRNQSTVSTAALPTSSEVTNFSIFCEWLGLSQFSAMIIAEDFTMSSSTYGNWVYYGISPSTTGTVGGTGNPKWPDPMSATILYPATALHYYDALSARIDVLLQQTGIEYNELLQLLTTDYLNPVNASTGNRRAVIYEVTGATTGTCHLNLLRLVFGNPASTTSLSGNADAQEFYRKLHRFIRLYKTGTLSISQWDIVLRSMYIIGSTTVSAIDIDFFQQMGRLLMLADDLRIRYELIPMWFNSVDTVNYRDYVEGSTRQLPSVYERVFSNAAVVNHATTNPFLHPSTTYSSTYAQNSALIANICGIKESEVVSLISLFGTSVTMATNMALPVLSRLYILSLLAKSWKITIEDLVAAINLVAGGSSFVSATNLSGSGSSTVILSSLTGFIDKLDNLHKTIIAIQQTPFTIKEFAYLAADADPNGSFRPTETSVQGFMESLRTELAKNSRYTPSGTTTIADANLLDLLSGVVYTSFSKEFKISVDNVEAIFSKANITTDPFNTLLSHFLEKIVVEAKYPYTRLNIDYISPLASGTVLTPIGYPNDKAPSFPLQRLIDCYCLVRKMALLINKLKLNDDSFRSVFLMLNVKTGVSTTVNIDVTGFDFSKLPVFTNSSGVATDFVGITVTAATSASLLSGLLRAAKLTEVATKYAFDSDTLNQYIAAISTVKLPTSATTYATVVSSFGTDLQACFDNLRALLFKDDWGTMGDEVFGSIVPSTFLTTLGTGGPVSLLKTNFSVVGTSTTTNSNYTARSYDNLSMYLNLLDIMYWCKTMGVTPTTVKKALVEDVSLTDSRKLIVAAKGKYTDEQWAKIAKPLRDPIRTKQRDALVAYTQVPANTLFADLLIDTQTDACMITSRIKQAISSVQLFIDRILLGQETYDPGSGLITLSIPQSSMNEWNTWRKWYGVWQANRKILFYPEDWLEPELRDDKSSFFKELEADLSNDDITADVVQDATLNYLKKLDEVARLEPVGTCDIGNNITHAFSRTYSSPHKYFHRVRESGVWLPWEKVDIDIPSNHILPYVWNNRLFLFWITIIDRSVPVPASLAQVKANKNLMAPGSAQDYINGRWFYNSQEGIIGENTGSGGTDLVTPPPGGVRGHADPQPQPLTKSDVNTPTYKQLEVTLHWSEYKKGKWQQQKASKRPAVLKVSPWLMDQLYMHIFNPGFDPANPTAMGVKGKEGFAFDYLMDNRQQSVIEFMKTRFTLFPHIQGTSPNIPLGPNSEAPINGDLYILLSYPLYGSVWNPDVLWGQDDSTHLKSFHFSSQMNDAEVARNVYFMHNYTPPVNMYFKNNAMVSYPGYSGAPGMASDSSSLSKTKFPFYRDTTNISKGFYIYDLERGASVNVYDRGANQIMLDSIIAPKFRVVPKAGDYNTAPFQDKFMFEDGVNTYFVTYQTPATPKASPYHLIGLTLASEDAGAFYGVSSAVAMSAHAVSIGSGGTVILDPPGPPITGGTLGGYPSPGGSLPGGTTWGPGSSTGGGVFWDPGIGYPTTSPYTGGVVGSGTVSWGGTLGGGSGGIFIDPGGTVLIGPPILLKGGPYLFETFYHPHVTDYIKMLNSHGIEGLMRPDFVAGSGPWEKIQYYPDTMNFAGNYTPSWTWVDFNYPQSTINFEYSGAYSIYNWELFFHLPMMMAQKLSANKQYFDARRWYHYIFDPTSQVNMDFTGVSPDSRKYWKFFKFFQKASGTIDTLDSFLALVHSGSLAACDQVTASKNNPFQPYAIARMRIEAFMKNVLMKYLDNLIAWADDLFMQDTIESINEATNLYITAANILGKKPTSVPQRVTTRKYSYRELVTTSGFGYDSLGEASVPLESYIDPGPSHVGGSTGFASAGATNVSYFCMQPNDKLLSYWDVVADRLFKIRHCQNIEGAVQKLPLFDPPIDPGMLVRAAAAGLSAGDLISGSVNASNYRFTYLLQKANEFCGDVKALGSALLSAIEKKDAEDLACIRSGQEIAVQKAMLLLKQIQLEEASANLVAAFASKETAVNKQKYYKELVDGGIMSKTENKHIIAAKIAIGLQTAATIVEGVAAVVGFIPSPKVAPMGVGVEAHTGSMAGGLSSVASTINTAAAVSSAIGAISQTIGGYERRMREWAFQKDSSDFEIRQLEKQIDAAQIRVEIAQKEIENQQLQFNNSSEVDQFMRTKYTNAELYTWMKGQITGIYFQAYKMALTLAKTAEKCYQNELPKGALGAVGFIKAGAWDSLRSGLLAGEKLQFDIRTMENAYMQENNRTLELTKHISLGTYFTEKLLTLKATGSCSISIPEELYDLDYPGHYYRIIKTVSLTIPCVAGPYATVPCKLTLSNSQVRVVDSSASTSAFRTLSVSPCKSIATSTAQNDNGMFDFNFKDERYLPFEGHGAISQWSFDLGGALPSLHVSGSSSMDILPFDYNSISDVILHVKYTAIEGVSSFKQSQADNLRDKIAAHIYGTYPGSGTGLELTRLFSLKHEFPNEWFAYVKAASATVVTGSPTMDVVLTTDHFPYFSKGHNTVLTGFYFVARLKKGIAVVATKVEGYHSGSTSNTVTLATLPATSVSSGAATMSGTPHTINDTVTGGNLPVSLAFKHGTAYFDLDVNYDDIYMIAVYQVS